MLISRHNNEARTLKHTRNTRIRNNNNDNNCKNNNNDNTTEPTRYNATPDVGSCMHHMLRCVRFQCGSRETENNVNETNPCASSEDIILNKQDERSIRPYTHIDLLKDVERQRLRIQKFRERFCGRSRDGIRVGNDAWCQDIYDEDRSFG